MNEVDQKVASEITSEIVSTWQGYNSDPRPFVLLIGGFQGSGKTSVLKSLREQCEFLIISGDIVRHKLNNRGYSVDPLFADMVDEIVNPLQQQAIGRKLSFALDRNGTPAKIVAIKNLLKETGPNDYRVVAILLTASKETLLRRMATRVAVDGAVTGRPADLEQSLKKYGELDPSNYDLVLDSETTNPEKAAAKIRPLLL